MSSEPIRIELPPFIMAEIQPVFVRENKDFAIRYVGFSIMTSVGMGMLTAEGLRRWQNRQEKLTTILAAQGQDNPLALQTATAEPLASFTTDLDPLSKLPLAETLSAESENSGTVLPTETEPRLAAVPVDPSIPILAAEALNEAQPVLEPTAAIAPSTMNASVDTSVNDASINNVLDGLPPLEPNAMLWGVNLSGAKLPGVDLSGANLVGANLAGVDFWGANLSGADLTGANLTGANLACANLTDADLTDADLTEANLTEANLAGAELAGAIQ